MGVVATDTKTATDDENEDEDDDSDEPVEAPFKVVCGACDKETKSACTQCRGTGHVLALFKMWTDNLCDRCHDTTEKWNCEGCSGTGSEVHPVFFDTLKYQKASVKEATKPSKVVIDAKTTCCTSGCKQPVKEEYELQDWLIVDNPCDNCAKFFCKRCARVCHACYDSHPDWDDDYDEDVVAKTYCKSCATGDLVINTTTCKVGHERWLCNKHASSPCGECRANENFAGKMGVF